MKSNRKFSVLMSVYKKDNPAWFDDAIESVCNQTLKPSEIVIIVDGPVPDEILNVIDTKKKKYPFIVDHRLEENIGLGRVLEKGVPLCSNEIIARMDSDDISKPERFEKEMKYLEENDCDLVGSDAEEFCDDPNEIVSIREVPKTYEEIKKYIKSRNPFNHGTLMFKKSAVLAAGNYKDMHYCEDYYLWVRMLLSGAKMANMGECLVKFRMNKDTFKRRGGMKYYKSQKKLFKFMKANKIINWFEYRKVLFARFMVHVLMPGWMKEWVYKKHLRKKAK